MEIFIYLIAVYISVVFILSRLIIPHLGFKEDKLPDLIPESMAEKIIELKNKAENQEQFLNLAYDFLGFKYSTGRLNTIIKFNYLFKSLKEAWMTDGYAPCTISNYILKIFLVKSGWFKEEDIKRRQIFFNFILHQYLQVKINDKWLDVDVGEKQRGLPIGRHLKYFG